MNPYAQPQSNLELSIENGDSKRIKWLSICGAALVYLLATAASVAAILTGAMAVPEIDMPEFVLISCFFTPWILGAVFLATRVKSRWIAHGLLYSLIPSLASMLFFSFFLEELIVLLILIAPFALLASVVLSLASMAITRFILRAMNRAIFSST